MAERQIVIRNAAVITGCGPVHPDGFVHIRDGRIAAVGSARGTPRVSGATVIDAKGRYVLPGLINPHMHLYSALASGMSVSGRMRSFGQILEGVWWKFDRALTLEDVYISAALGAIESLRCGVTTVFDHHASYGAIMGSLGAIAEAVGAVGIRASLSYEISDRNGKDSRNAALDESASWLELVRAELAEDPRCTFRGMVGLHASMTLSDKTLMLARGIMDEYGVPSHVHVAEGVEDVRVTRRKFKKTPVARFLQAGVLGQGSIAAHCVHVDARDISMLARAATCVAHNPQSNLNNAVGVAPVLKMIGRGVPVAVGTDGMSAGLDFDIGLASLIHKPGARDAQAGWEETAYMVWEVAPWLATQIYGYGVGHIRKGCAADVVIFDAIPKTPLTRHNALAHLIFGALHAPARTVVVDGVVRMRDFVLPGIDEERLAAEARKRARALWRRMK